MKQLVSLLSVWSLCCCFQENLVESLIPKCALGQMTVQWLNGTFKECLHCEHCHPGRGLYPHKCGDTVTFPPQIECKKCESGKTFSDAYDSSRCKLCHSCAEHEVVTKTCTLTSDTKCSKTCNSDYFFSSSQQVCKKCSYCCLDGKDEEQPQCINKGLKAINQYCSPRPDRTCTPTQPPTKSSSHGKIGWILLCVAIGLLLGAILYCLWRKHMKKKRQDVPNDSNVENGCDLTVACDQSEALITQDNQGGLIQQETSTSQEVQQNAGLIIASAASTPQRSRKGIPHIGGFEESLPSVNVLPKNFTRQTDRTEEKKADESARVAIPPEKKDAEDDVSDNIDTEGAQGGHERKGSFSDRHNYPNTSRNYESLSEEDPDQHVEDESARVAMPAENKDADESARVTMVAENKDGEDDVSDNIDGEGAHGGRERKGSFSGRFQSLCRKLSNTSIDYESLSRKDPDQPIEGESARVTMPAENKDGKDDVSDNIVGKGAQGGRERKGSFSGRFQSLCRKLSNTSIDYEPLSGEDPDQPVEADESAIVAMLAENKDGEDDVFDNIDGEVSAAVHQRTRPRSNSLLRTPSIGAIKEENSDQPSGQSWPPKEVTIKRSPDSPEIQAGSRVEFRCEVNGCQQVLYRWFQDEQELPGENSSTLIFDPLKMQDFGSYRCKVRSDKHDDVSCVESDVVQLDVTPAEGKSYKTLAEVFKRSIYLTKKVENLLRKKVGGIAGYEHVASHYGMDIDVPEECENLGEGVIAKLGAEHPDLAVYHFCKVLKGRQIRRLDIVNELKGHLI